MTTNFTQNEKYVIYNETTDKIWYKLLMKVFTIKKFFSFAIIHGNLIKMGYIMIIQLRWQLFLRTAISEYTAIY